MNLDPFLEAPIEVQIHAVAAIAAFGLGLFQVFGPRLGRAIHIIFGITWTALMIVVAVSALFITELFGDWWSPIHLFVLLTAFGLWQAFRALSRGEFRAHGKHMRGLYFGALLIAGAFTFLPGRMMWDIVIAPLI
jgi:uncharacterized membrane protein